MHSETEIRAFLDKHGPDYWYHNFPVWMGGNLFTAGPDKGRKLRGEHALNKGGLTEDLVKGRRILDIGAFSGAYSFCLEDMGGEIVSVDILDPHLNGYAAVHHVRQSKARHCQCLVYDINREDFGEFDHIWFQGVLYHLKYPVLALERLSEVLKPGGLLCGSTTSSEGWVSTIAGEDTGELHKANLPFVLYKKAGLCRWYAPNSEAMKHWLRDSGFEPIRMWETDGGSKPDSPKIYTHFVAKKVGDPVLEFDVEKDCTLPHLSTRPVELPLMPPRNLVDTQRRLIWRDSFSY